jgi:hypothetical protein
MLTASNIKIYGLNGLLATSEATLVLTNNSEFMLLGLQTIKTWRQI